jgi:predicted dehydrogenase/NADPH:quinone reductase-like Zn-dependent oxidoreductase
MRQVLQHVRSGELEVAELPAPGVRPGSVLIGTRVSLISAGTERMLIEFSRANLIQKARQQPERVQQVLDKIRADGLAPTLEAVFRKLDQPLPLGYCNAGVVLEVGAGVSDLRPGDRVASNGAHAEIVSVPRHLCARVPDGVTDEDAAFTVLGSIALQGLRLAAPTLGETFAVFGVGLLGLLTVQLLRAHGCEVLAIDPNRARLDLAERFGARAIDLGAGADPVAAAREATGRGVDGALITASAEGDEIVHQAAQACRARGRIVLVGVVGLNLRRSDFFEKELTFQVSCSYGPGRYDEAYEQLGRDYPIGHVRWTEARNFEAVLGAMRDGRVLTAPLVTHRIPLADATRAYDVVRTDPRALGVLLVHAGESARAPIVTLRRETAPSGREPVVGLIGAGAFARSVLLPALGRTGARLAYVANREAVAARDAAQRFGAEHAVTDHRPILDDPRVDAVLVTTRHDRHAALVCEALAAGKHVFVEKPLALDEEELERVRAALAAADGRQLVVGYNRRFSPHSVALRRALAGRAGPLCLSLTVNAGEIPRDHWIHDPQRGGGRIVGEGCHFLDLLAWIADSPIATVSAAVAAPGAPREDHMAIALTFADGSVGALQYFANGARAYAKETLEVFSDGRVLRLENFRRTRAFGASGFRTVCTLRQDKGHAAEMAAFVERLRAGGPPLMPFDRLRNVSLASFAAVRSARERLVLPIDS